MFWTFKYAGRNDFFLQITHMDLEDLSLLSDEEFYSMSEAFTSNHF